MINSSHFVSALTIFQNHLTVSGTGYLFVTLYSDSDLLSWGWFPSLDVLTLGQTFPLVRAFTGSCYIRHTSWPEHAQRSLHSWGLIGIDCALCSICYTSHVAPCTFNSSHHFVICTHYTNIEQSSHTEVYPWSIYSILLNLPPTRDVPWVKNVPPEPSTFMALTLGD